jgi:glycogen operon protein
MIFNAYWESLDFELPQVGIAETDPWHRWIDTSLESPHDIVEWQNAPSVSGRTYRAGPRSVVVMWASLAVDPAPGV